MEAFLVSLVVVALGEMGDKTQLLAFFLAAKFKRPVPIVAGIVAAILANHLFAALAGAWVAAHLGPAILRWVIGLSFLGMAAWMLIPDRARDAVPSVATRFGVFGTTVVAFFLAEMGDKTQIATVALAARYRDVILVVAGTTLGMLIADVPAVWLGATMARKVSLPLVRALASLGFAALGVLTLIGVDSFG